MRGPCTRSPPARCERSVVSCPTWPTTRSSLTPRTGRGCCSARVPNAVSQRRSWRAATSATAPARAPRSGSRCSPGPTSATGPAPTVWSPLEYACHVRDVCDLFDRRLALMLTEDDPLFENWDQDVSAVVGRYGDQDPATVADALVAAAASIAARFDSVTGDQWARTGRRTDGAVFTSESSGATSSTTSCITCTTSRVTTTRRDPVREAPPARRVARPRTRTRADDHTTTTTTSTGTTSTGMSTTPRPGCSASCGTWSPRTATTRPCRWTASWRPAAAACVPCCCPSSHCSGHRAAAGGVVVIRLGRAARRHPAQRRRRADRRAARRRVHARPPGRRPGATRTATAAPRTWPASSSCCSSRSRPCSPAYEAIAAAAGPARRCDHLGPVAAAGVIGFARQRAGRPLPDQGRPRDRLGRPRRRRAARAHGRLHLARPSCSAPPGSRSASSGPTRSSACSSRVAILCVLSDAARRGLPAADGRRRPGPRRRRRGDAAGHRRGAGRRRGAAALDRPPAARRVRDRRRPAT